VREARGVDLAMTPQSFEIASLVSSDDVVENGLFVEVTRLVCTKSCLKFINYFGSLVGCPYSLLLNRFKFFGGKKIINLYNISVIQFAFCSRSLTTIILMKY